MLCRRLRTAWFAAGISLFAAPVLAAQPSHAMAANTVSALLPASLFKPGETIAEGDLVAVSRAFGDWTMHCEMRLSTKRNICAIEQSVASEGGGLVWRISESQAGGQIVLLSLPSDMLPEKGLHLSFPDLEKTISGKHWQCSATACVAAVPFDDILQAAIRQTKQIGFTYTAHTKDDQERTVHLNVRMNGFAEALQAMRENPFGQNVAAHDGSEQKQPLQHMAKSESVKASTTRASRTDPAAAKPVLQLHNKPAPSKPRAHARKLASDAGGLF